MGRAPRTTEQTARVLAASRGAASKKISRGQASRSERGPDVRVCGDVPQRGTEGKSLARQSGIFSPMPLRGQQGFPCVNRGLRSPRLAGPRQISCGVPPGPRLARSKAPSPLRFAGAVQRVAGQFVLRWQTQRDTAFGSARTINCKRPRNPARPEATRQCSPPKKPPPNSAPPPFPALPWLRHHSRISDGAANP